MRLSACLSAAAAAATGPTTIHVDKHSVKLSHITVSFILFFRCHFTMKSTAISYSWAF